LRLGVARERLVDPERVRVVVAHVQKAVDPSGLRPPCEALIALAALVRPDVFTEDTVRARDQAHEDRQPLAVVSSVVDDRHVVAAVVFHEAAQCRRLDVVIRDDSHKIASAAAVILVGLIGIAERITDGETHPGAGRGDLRDPGSAEDRDRLDAGR
jgi:hypothetical protein